MVTVSGIYLGALAPSASNNTREISVGEIKEGDVSLPSELIPTVPSPVFGVPRIESSVLSSLVSDVGD